MSPPLPERADIRQLRIQAKELLRSLHAADPEAVALASTHDPSLSLSQAKLVDAQRILARKHGFESWPKLVDEVETPVLIGRMKRAIELGEADRLEKLLREKAALRKRINDPMFDFDTPPIFRASGNKEAAKLLPILVRYGADPNVRSTWWAGGFSPLDGADANVAEILVQLGAKFDVWSAAKHGKVEILKGLLDDDPASVNAPGGDGETPLHFASTPETAELLIERGANLEQRDIDHESTPVQYQVRNKEVLRVLVKHGAKPDVFTAAVLDDVEMLRRIVEEDPEAPMARVGKAPFTTVKSEGGHIYVYTLGGGRTPQQVAAQEGSLDVLRDLERHSTPTRNLIAAASIGDEATVKRILSENPSFEIDPEDRSTLAWAAMHGNETTVRLLLEAGFDPTAPGMDSGSALHVACWFGNLPVVRLLVNRVPLDLLDANHGSPPLGWATHGAQWCHNAQGDYVGVVEALVAAGADVHAPANSGGTSMLNQAGDREDVKEALRKLGAE